VCATPCPPTMSQELGACQVSGIGNSAPGVVKAYVELRYPRGLHCPCSLRTIPSYQDAHKTRCSCPQTDETEIRRPATSSQLCRGKTPTGCHRDTSSSTRPSLSVTSLPPAPEHTAALKPPSPPRGPGGGRGAPCRTNCGTPGRAQGVNGPLAADIFSASPARAFPGHWHRSEDCGQLSEVSKTLVHQAIAF
jgi:hypothetical protein